jgi:hypothetical protein
MPFPKGRSPNPGGKRKPVGLSRAVRASEGLKTWAKLLEIRDEQVLEPRRNSETEQMEYVVPSVKVLADVCFKVLAYTWGTPIQQADTLEDRIKVLEKRLDELLNVRPRGNGFHGDYAS